MNNNKGKFSGLMPLIVFIVLYIVITIVTHNASALPLNVGILIAMIIALIQCSRKRRTDGNTFDDIITMMCKGGGDDTLILMFFIFLEAGIFYLLAENMGAVNSVSNLGLKLLPSSMVLPGLFVIGCVLSFAMGTSMGTVTALMPVAINIAGKTDMGLALVCGAVVSGAMFGDNLSFISDTTIAATRTQEVEMRDKFRANFLMVLPAVILTIVYYAMKSTSTSLNKSDLTWSAIQLIPYILVIVLSLIGVHVIISMGAAIFSGLIVGWAQGSFGFIKSLTVVGDSCWRWNRSNGEHRSYRGHGRRPRRTDAVPRRNRLAA